MCKHAVDFEVNAVFNCDMNSLRHFVKDVGLTATAGMLSVSVQRLANWIERGVPVEQCAAIEMATNGRVTRKDLRPNDWQSIWPELAQASATIAQPATETVAAGANV